MVDGDGLIGAAPLDQQGGQVLLGGGVLRCRLEAALVGLDGFIQTLPVVQDDTQVEVREGMGGINLGCGAVAGQGLLGLVGPLLGDAQMPVGLGVPGAEPHSLLQGKEGVLAVGLQSHAENDPGMAR